MEAQRDALQAKIDKIRNQQLEEANRASIALGSALLRDPGAHAVVGEWLQKAISGAKGKEKAALELAATALSSSTEAT